MTSQPRSAQPFKVELEGIDLSDERRAAIASGIRRIVLTELADIDFQGDRQAALVLALPDGGQTQGIWATAVPRDRLPELNRLMGGG
jgi:hypothetical protein